MLVWRICRAEFAKTAFSGIGGLKAEARWNHAGNPIVYTAQSLSLASLEIWVHVDPTYPLPEYLAFSAEIPDNLPIHVFEERDLPDDWNRPTLHEALQDLGTKWRVERSTAVSRVPATTTKGEFNYLLNPEHPDFAGIIEGPAQKFEFDPRMKKS